MFINLSSKQINKIIICVLFVIAIFFATYQLTESPSFWYDEGWYFQSAANLAESGIFGLQLAPGNIIHISMYQTVSYPLIYPLALWMKVFGISVLSGRALMVVFILALIIASYFLVKRIFGNIVALGSVALLATFAPLYGNGKSILGEVPGLLYFILFLLFLNLVISTKDKKIVWIILSGIFAGLCISTKPFFILLVPAIIVGIIIGWKRGDISRKDILIGILSFCVPIIAWFFIQFQSGDSVFQVFSYYANPYAFEDPNYQKSILAVVMQSIKALFTNISTIYTVILISLWVFAVSIKVYIKEKINIEEIIAFIFTITIMVSYLRIGGIFRYFFPAQILILIFLPNTLRVINNFIFDRSRYLNIVKYYQKSIPVIAIIFLSLFGLYQLMFNSWVAEAYGSHKTEFWQEYFGKISTTTSVFFYDTPEVAPFIQSKNYYQSILTTRMNTIGKEQLSHLKFGTVDMVVVETLKYNLLKDTVFENYIVDQTAYKYSILRHH